MAFTLAQLQTELQNRGYSTDTATAQTAAINAALRDIRNYRRWPWYEQQQTINATVNQAYISAPATLVEPQAVRIRQTNNDNANLVWLDPQDFRDKETLSPATGYPTNWTWREGKILLYPTPDAAYPIVLDFSGPPVTLANPADTVLLPDNFINPVIWGALKHLAYRERDWEAMGVADQQFQQTISRAASDIGLTQMGQAGEVERSGFYESYDGPIGIMIP